MPTRQHNRICQERANVKLSFMKAQATFLLDSSESAMLKAIPFCSLKCVRIYIYIHLYVYLCVYLYIFILIYSIYRQSTPLGCFFCLLPFLGITAIKYSVSWML